MIKMNLPVSNHKNKMGFVKDSSTTTTAPPPHSHIKQQQAHITFLGAPSCTLIGCQVFWGVNHWQKSKQCASYHLFSKRFLMQTHCICMQPSSQRVREWAVYEMSNGLLLSPSCCVSMGTSSYERSSFRVVSIKSTPSLKLPAWTRYLRPSHPFTNNQAHNHRMRHNTIHAPQQLLLLHTILSPSNSKKRRTRSHQ